MEDRRQSEHEGVSSSLNSADAVPDSIKVLIYLVPKSVESVRFDTWNPIWRPTYPGPRESRIVVGRFSETVAVPSIVYRSV